MLIILILAGSAAPVYAATCTGNYPENGAMTFQLPASITVEPDVSVGTVIYEGSIESGQIDMDCRGYWQQIQRLRSVNGCRCPQWSAGRRLSD